MTDDMRENYLKDPCTFSSLPYYKMKSIEIPKNLIIINGKEEINFNKNEYLDEVYFRLINDFKNVNDMKLPEGYIMEDVSDKELSQHINSCYENISISENDIKIIKESEVYNSELFVAVKNRESGKIAASGIAVLDGKIKEGVLEWIQVSESERRKGLGEFIVNYLLSKLKDKADFVTVSGKVHNKNNPEKLYRKCGFKGDNYWHILWRK